MKNKLIKFTLLAGVALAFGAASSAQAQYSAGYCPAPVYQSYGPTYGYNQAQVYGNNYGYGQSVQYGSTCQSGNCHVQSVPVQRYNTVSPRRVVAPHVSSKRVYRSSVVPYRNNVRIYSSGRTCGIYR